MNQVRRIVFAATAALLRALAWLPLRLATRIEDLADAYEARARGPPGASSR